MTRIKGQRSGGPQTAAGKAKSSRNALRHGLSVSILTEPAMCAEVEKLARILAGQYCDDFHLSQARIIAEAQIDLSRIRDAKARILNTHLEAAVPLAIRCSQAPDAASSVASDKSEAEALPTEPMETVPNLKQLKQLARLERYELRTTWRRRRAMRAFLSQA